MPILVLFLTKPKHNKNYSDVIVGAMASQITNPTIVYWTVYSIGSICSLCCGDLHKLPLWRLQRWWSLVTLGGTQGPKEIAWWRHQMETFSALLALYAGNSPVPGEFPTQRPVTRSFDVFFDLRLNKRLSKQAWGWWFETPSRPLWRHRNENLRYTLRETTDSKVLTLLITNRFYHWNFISQ